MRKTDWVIGAVVFTGPDTKVVRNMLPAPRKVRSCLCVSVCVRVCVRVCDCCERACRANPWVPSLTRPPPQVTRLERSMNKVVMATLVTLGAAAFCLALANQVRKHEGFLPQPPPPCTAPTPPALAAGISSPPPPHPPPKARGPAPDLAPITPLPPRLPRARSGRRCTAPGGTGTCCGTTPGPSWRRGRPASSCR